MWVTASILLGPQLFGVLGCAAAVFLLRNRYWHVAVGIVVGADVLAWSWVSSLKTLGNVVYWGTAIGIGLALLDLARKSSLARRLLVVAVLASIALASTSLWSISPHETLRQSATFGSVLVVVAFAVVRLRSLEDDERLLQALAVLVPAMLVLMVLVILVDHREAVAAGGGVSGFVNGANAFGIILALVLPFLVAARPLRERWVALAVAVGVTAFVVTLSGSRSGILALLLGLLVFELGRRRWARLGIAVAATVVGAAIAIAWTPPIPTLGRPLATLIRPGVKPTPTDQNPPQAKASLIFGGGRAGNQTFFGSLTGARDEAWRVAVDLLSKQPVRGTGFGTGTDIFVHYGVRKRFTNFVGAFDPHANVHEAYLQELLELGIPGGILFLAFPFAAFCVAAAGIVRRWRSPFEAAVGGAVAATFVATLFESVLAGFGPMTLLAWLGAGCLVLRVGVPARRRSSASLTAPSSASADASPIATALVGKSE